MSQTHSSVLVHCVFSTKQRASLITDPPALWRYLAVLAQDREIKAFAVGGTVNHVHMLISVPPAMCLATTMREVKAHSSRWMREHGRRFAWQEGYGAFSVSQSQRQVVIDYIERQEEHHRKWTFEQEFLTLLKKAEMEFDPKFVFG